jgi:hypothetical protein
VLSRPPPSLSVESPEKGIEETPATVKLRFFQWLRDLCPVVQQRLKEAQERYKRNFDNSIRDKNKEVSSGDWVYLKREVHSSSVNLKLDAQVDGPFQVLENSGHALLLQQRESKNRISSDRVPPTSTPRPRPVESVDPERPTDTVSGRLQKEKMMHKQNTPAPAEGEDCDGEPTPTEEEYVVECLVRAKQIRDGTLHY